MLLICYGTRPELIKISPLLKYLKNKGIKYSSLFSGQHDTLIGVYKDLLPENPTYIFKDVMIKNQSLCSLFSSVHLKMGNFLKDHPEYKYILVQGDTTTAIAIGLSAFHEQRKVIHLEAGLRTHDKDSPFPEEVNRLLLGSIANIHLCPTKQSVINLHKEGITHNVFRVGNTIVDIFDEINKKKQIKKDDYFLITLHRRENRGNNINNMLDQVKKIDYKCKYITHPSLKELVEEKLRDSNNVEILDPVDYSKMVKLINESKGIITDSGGIQEEAVCANKKVLICRNTTERPETIESGYGKLINTNIIHNITFLLEDNQHSDKENPYGSDVCSKIYDVLKDTNVI